MEQKILELLGSKDYRPMTAGEIAARLHLAPKLKHSLGQVLQQLERTGRIARVKQGDRFALPREVDLIPGRIRMTRRGSGRVQPDDPKLPSISISNDAAATAMNGDRVLIRKEVKPFHRQTRDEEQIGRVVRVLERARTAIVGTLQRGKKFLYVIPDDPRFPRDIMVPEPRDVGRPAREGDKVVVEMREWTSWHVNPEGEIVEVLGPPDAEGVDMLSILRQYDLPLHFPKRVLQEARSFGTEVSPGDLKDRVDCRGDMVITIDPVDAKDFDDAICVRRASKDTWKLWVHIADVSHYVRPGSALDEEASLRGNSTYLVDRVIPMLPEALSNELCSLKPGVDRLTKCVEFDLSLDGRVLRSKCYSGVIRSQRRFHYREALEVLQREPRDEIERMLHHANDLAQRLRKHRFAAGSLDLDFPETKIRLNEQGKIDRIERVENDISHQLIEEFMLLANEAVARRLIQLGRPALHRIHEPPDNKRLEEFREDVLSHHIPCGNLAERREVQKLLQRLNTLPIGAALKVGFLRSLMRARYAVEPLGHYGLAKKQYAHFTSPIRRYADLVVHRALFGGQGTKLAAAPLTEVADRISETERNSADAERDSRDVKLFAYLLSQLESRQPTIYEALINDVRNFGFFVDVQGLGMSGLVPLSGMTDDFYNFNPTRGQLVGRRTGRVIKLGDRVRVQVAKVDTFKRQVDYRLAAAPAPAKDTRKPHFDRASRVRRRR